MTRRATLYRMVLPEHTCPYGVAAKEKLEAAGYGVVDHVLTSREDVEAFKAKNGLATTPLVCIENEPIGGLTELEDFLSARPAE